MNLSMQSIVLDPVKLQNARESHAHVKAMFHRRDGFPELFPTQGEAREALRGFKAMNPQASGYVADANCEETGFRVYVRNGGIYYAL